MLSLIHILLDEELEGYLQLIKTDTETGKAVKIANTSFALYKLDDKGNKTRISMIDPANGSATKKTDVFYTDADGLMKTPEKLPLGRYLIEELQGPEGYYISPYSNSSNPIQTKARTIQIYTAFNVLSIDLSFLG